MQQQVPDRTDRNEVEPLLLRARDVARLEAIDQSTLWRRIAAGAHPRPIHIGGTARFLKQEIDDYIAGLVAERDAAAANPALEQEARHG